jgi:myo-inositol-1(or 4)-monophosphatase
MFQCNLHRNSGGNGILVHGSRAQDHLHSWGLSTSMNSLDRDMAVAMRLAREAGAILRNAHSTRLEAHETVSGELATSAHSDADALVRAGLHSEFPDDGIYSERAPHSPERFLRSRVWMIDPLDGVTNFLACGDEFSISIGLTIEGEACLGVIYNPMRDELFAGTRDGGVRLNGAPVNVSRVFSLESSFVTVSRREWTNTVHDAAVPFRMVAMAGTAYKLARVAAGLDDGMFSLKPRPEWATCAGMALVKSAGGLVTALNGEFIRCNRADLRQQVGMVAAGPGIHSSLLRCLQQVATPTRQVRIEGAGA